MTNKQRDLLTELGYIGPYNLTTVEAAEIIDELFEDQRVEAINANKDMEDWIT